MKKRTFPEHNYSAIFINGKTIRIALDGKNPIGQLDYPEFYDISFGNKCESGRCYFCFLEGSLISTSSSTKKIEDIQIGDEVFTFNQYLQRNQVEQLHKRAYSGQIICLELENGKVIKCTPNHKLFTKNRGWVEAEKLTNDDELLEISELL